MDFLRLAAALIMGGVVHYCATTDVPLALGIISAFVTMAAGWNEARLDRLGRAMDANFKLLRRSPNPQSLED